MGKSVAYFEKWAKFLPISQNGQFHRLGITYAHIYISLVKINNINTCAMHSYNIVIYIYIYVFCHSVSFYYYKYSPTTSKFGLQIRAP